MEKRRYATLCLAVLVFGFAASGQSIRSVAEVGPLTSTVVPDVVAQTTPVVCDGSSIFLRSESGTSTPEELLREEYFIVGCDYNPSLSSVAYRYGTGDFSIPAIFDIEDGSKKVLETILKDGSESFVYEIVDNLMWLSENRLIYSVYDASIGESILKIFELDSGRIVDLKAVGNPLILDVAGDLDLVLYRNSERGVRSFFLLDLQTMARQQVLGPEYITGYIVTGETLLGVVNDIDSPIEIRLLHASRRVDVVSVPMPEDAIQGIAAFDRSAAKFVVETRSGSPPYSSVYNVFEIEGLAESGNCE